MKNFTLFFAAIVLLFGTAFAQQSERPLPQKEKSNEILKNIPPELVKPSVATTTEGSIKGVNSDVYYAYGTVSEVFKATLSSFPGTDLGSASTNIQASEYINGTIYAVTYNNTTGGNGFGTVNQATGAFTALNNNFQNDGVSLCYNPTNGLTYVFGWNGGSFGTVNLSTGAYTHVGSTASGTTGTLYAAIDNDGICYAIKNTTSQFGTINLSTGAWTAIGTGSVTASYIQEMSIDRETNELYWLSYTSSSECVLYKVNKSSGALTSISTVSVTANPTMFAIATDVELENCDPISNLNVTAAGNSVNLTWTAAPGSPTGYKIEFNGTTLTTITETSYTHNSVADGLHTYTVTAIYSEACIPFGVSETVMVGNMCILRIEMQDSEGDGWDDSHIEVKSGGTLYGTATVPTDAYNATAFIVVPGSQLSFSWVVGEEEGGAYDSDCSFQIFNSDEALIYECYAGDAVNYSGDFFSYENDCGFVSINPPTNLQITNSECNFTMTWTAPAGVTNPTYNIYKNGTQEVSNHNSTSYEFTLAQGEVFNWCVETAAEGAVSEKVCADNTGCSVGINGNAFANVVVAPNPASTTVTISGDVSKVEIYNTLGQLIETHTNNFSVINVSGLNNGVYFFKLFNANNETSTRQIVISK